jgi:outer membrane autotransporter protein
MSKTNTRNILRITALAAALLGAYGQAYGQVVIDGGNSSIGAPYDLDSSPYTGVTVKDGGVARGDGTVIQADTGKYALDVQSGGQISLIGGSVANAGTTGDRTALHATGEGALATTQGVALSNTSAGLGTGDLSNVVSAGDQAMVTLNGGSVSSESTSYGRGILAGTGAEITANGVDISTAGTLSNAVHAFSARETSSEDPDAASITLDGGKVSTTGANSYGLSSQNNGAAITTTGNTAITTTGANSFGASAYNGGALDLTGVTLSTSGSKADGIAVNESLGAQAPGRVPTPNVGSTLTLKDSSVTSGKANGIYVGKDSTAIIDNTDIHAAGHGLIVEDGGSATLNGGSVASTGIAQHAIVADGSDSSFNATDVDISAAGSYDNRGEITHAIDLTHGATATVTGGAIKTTGGNFTTGIFAATDSTATANNVAISTTGDTGIGVRAYSAYENEAGIPSGATPDQTVNINGGSITTQGEESYGIWSQDMGSHVIAGSYTDPGDSSVNPLAITTSGKNAYGVAVFGGADAKLTDVAIKTSGDGASGVSLNTVGPLYHPTLNPTVGATFTMSGGSINTSGANADGILATAGSTATLTNTSVTTQGGNAAAASVNDGSTLTATGSTLVSQQGDGVAMTDNATVNLTGTRVESAGASLVSNLNTAGRTQDIIIGSGSDLEQNNGTLLQVNRTDAGMDGLVNLTLKAGSTSRGDVIDLDGLSTDAPVRSAGGQTNFTVDTGASWTGIVRGINDAMVADGGSFVDNGGAPIAGNVTGGENSTIVFNNGATIGGGVSTGDGSQGTFNGTTSIGGNVTGTGSTLAFNGPTTIGQNVSTQGSQVTFGNSATINQSVMGGSDSTVAFNGPATIAQDVTGGSGSSFTFAGPTTIGQSVTGSGTSFEFSQGEKTTIGGDVTLGDGSSLKGGTTDTPISIGGDATVTNGATLGGNLFVQGSLNGAGGTVSPGNSVGTQSYGSIASLGSTYKAEVNAAGKSDLVIARTGDVDLSATNLTVAQENGNGGYVLDHDYTILQTVDGNVKNKFKSTALDSSFANTLVALDPVKYDPKDVKVSLSVDGDKVAAVRTGLSSNQNATLDGVISVAGRNASADAALTSTDSQGSLDQLSGEIHASTQAALLNSAGLVQRTLSDRVRGNLGTGAAQGGTYPLWAQVVGDWNTLSDDGNAAKVKTSIGGLFLGGDADIGQGWRLGGALGYTDGDIKVDDRSSKSDVKGYTAAIYGGNSWETSKGNINFLAGASYTHNDIDTSRSVTVGGNQSLSADYHADTTQLFTELGYAMPVGGSSMVEPYLGLAWLSQHAQGFSESGGAAALQGDGSTDDITTSTLGLRGKTMLDFGSKQATLSAGLGWRHAAGDVDPSRQMSFIQGNGAAFSVAGAPIAKDAAVVDLGAEVAVGKSTAMGLSYNGQFGSGNTDSTGSLYVKVRFK